MSFSVDDRELPRAAGTDDRGARLEATSRWLDAELAGQDVPPLLAIIGFDNADLLTVLERRAPATRVLALEPNPGVAGRLLAHADVQRWRAAGRLAYLVDPDYAGADEAWRLFPPVPDAHKLIVRPDVARDGGPAAIRALRIYKQIFFGAKANAEARRKFAPGYLAGSLHNLPEILAGQDVRGLTNAYRGVPAIVAAAGPSLDAVLDDLATAHDRAVLIAADTALRPLRARGLSPQFVVAVDPQALNARHFHELPPCPDTWLVSEGSIDPSVIAPFGSRAFWFRVSDHEPWPWYNQLGIEAGRVDVWGSVVTAAFQIAVLAGCDPIVFVGTDLSFTGGRPYCRGTTYEFDWTHLAAEGLSRDQAWRPFLKLDEQIRVADVHGRETATTPSMLSFRDWLVARARRSGRRVINATGAGIFAGEGIEQLGLRDVLTTTHRIPSPQDLAPARVTTASRADAARKLWEVHRTICRNEQATPPIDRWKAFCGEGFSLVAVGAAIERAARALERTDDVESARTTIPWTAFGAAGASLELLPHLPEAMIRFRALLAGGPLPPSPVERTTADGLVDAFEILRSISDAARRQPDLSAPAIAGHAGHIPLGSSHAWPVELGRAVRLFEALLGAVWPSSPLPPADSSFFTRHVAPPSHKASADHRSLGEGGLVHRSLGEGGLVHRSLGEGGLVHRSLGEGGLVHRSLGEGGTPIHLASLALALEWWLVSSYLDAATDSARTHVVARWRGLVEVLTTPADPKSGGGTVSLELDPGAGAPLELTWPSGDAALARALTGSATIRTGGTVSRTPLASMRASRRPMVTPRVLTDEGVARAVLPYSNGLTAQCTVIRGSESLVVREDGSVAPGFVWPRPTSGELPFGDGGAIAWSVGAAARWPEGGSGYVMYRRTATATPTIETLPFAPQVGTLWRERVYWACFPFGVGSWAPGEAAELSLPDRTLFSVLGDARGLRLGPRARTQDGAAERRLITEGWCWQPGQEPQPVSLGPLGVASSHCIAHGWHATAHPEADAIELRREDGLSVTMTCYYPFGVAWAGRSLLVSTVDGELLFFERFTDVLDDWTGGRR